MSVASLTGVLQRAAQRRRLGRESDKSSDRIERMEKTRSDLQDNSRSNSVMSTAASQYPLTHQSSSAMMMGRYQGVGVGGVTHNLTVGGGGG